MGRMGKEQGTWTKKGNGKRLKVDEQWWMVVVG